MSISIFKIFTLVIYTWKLRFRTLLKRHHKMKFPTVSVLPPRFFLHRCCKVVDCHYKPCTHMYPYKPDVLVLNISKQNSPRLGCGVSSVSVMFLYRYFILNASIATKVVCFSRLLKCLRSLYGKQCGPISDCSYRSSLFLVHAVCFYT